ncbi:MAG TPA: DUF2286 domain-containing protein [Pyrodictium sp.]|nr:DUF2286 domain-containing protein [Pyrodictium sp.]
MPKIVVVKSVEGKIEDSRIVEGELASIVKEIARKTLEEWDPEKSDFTIIKARYELRYKLPISPDLYDTINELNLEMFREENNLIVIVPVYTISFNNEWLEDKYHDKAIYVVTYYIDEEEKKQIEEYAAETTKAPKEFQQGSLGLTLTEEDIAKLEAGLEEEATQTSRKRRTSRSRKKK